MDFHEGGLTRDISIVDYGQSELDNYAEEFIGAQHRKITSESNPSAGHFSVRVTSILPKWEFLLFMLELAQTTWTPMPKRKKKSLL